MQNVVSAIVPCRPLATACAGQALAPLKAGWQVALITSYRGQHEKSSVDKTLQAVARMRVGGWLFINVFPVIDRWLIPRTRGRVKVALGQPILLLHTRGAKSGEPRTTPLLYTPLGQGFIVVASKAGAAHHPAQYHNIRAHPDAVSVEVDGHHVAVRPRLVEEPERSDLWRRVNDNYDGSRCRIAV